MSESISAGDVTNSQFIVGNNNRLTINEAAPQPQRTGEASNVPGGGSQTFVGRGETLTELHERLSSVNAVAITAIQGMGGIGKTELARQYARQYAASYPSGRCWLQARELDVASQIVAFAKVYLQIEPPEGLELPEQVAYCWSHWPGSERVLVVYDDVTAYGRVEDVLPPEESGRFVTLMTTRRQHLAVTVDSFEIEVLSEAAALELLGQIVGETRTAAELETAKAICEWVGYLPLALELVGQYLRQKPDVTYQKLQNRLESQRTEARALQKAYPGMTGKLGVIEAFELSWKALSEDEQDVACWLSLFALAPIPWELAESNIEEAEKEDFEDGRDALISRSLLRRIEQGSYQLHQLVREYFVAKLTQRGDADRLRQAYCQLMTALARQMPGRLNRELLLRLTPIMPHIAEVTTSWQDWLSNEDEEMTLPFVAMARFYEEQGAYSQAEPWYTDCIKATQNRFGNNHSDVATSLNNLALLFRSQGRYAEAEPLQVQALTLWRQLLGDTHPNVATGLNNLALLYESQGRYAEAEPLYMQALTIWRQLLGDAHPNVATTLDNLAGLYKSQGRYAEAEPLQMQALTIWRQLLGDAHPSVATSLNNLALLYKSQGRYAEAESLQMQALILRRQLLGDAHPNVATSLNNLAGLYKSQRRYTEAEPLYMQALDLNRQLLGDAHPHIAANLNNLAELYSEQGRHTEAESLYMQALDLNCQLLGDAHPNVAATLDNLALLYRSQGRHAEAESLLLQALDLNRQLLGDNHFAVTTSLNNLALLYESQGRYEQAEPLYIQAIAILNNRLDQDHPTTTTVFNNFIHLVSTVLEANQQSELSDNPLTQSIIEWLQSQPQQ